MTLVCGGEGELSGGFMLVYESRVGRRLIRFGFLSCI